MANIPSFLGIQPLVSHRFRLSGAGTLGAEVRLGGWVSPSAASSRDGVVHITPRGPGHGTQVLD